MSKEPGTKTYLRAEDFFKTPKETSIAKDVRQETLSQRNRTVLDQALVRQQEDWSFLAGQVVGAEDA